MQPVEHPLSYPVGSPQEAAALLFRTRDAAGFLSVHCGSPRGALSCEGRFRAQRVYMATSCPPGFPTGWRWTPSYALANCTGTHGHYSCEPADYEGEPGDSESEVTTNDGGAAGGTTPGIVEFPNEATPIVGARPRAAPPSEVTTSIDAGIGVPDASDDSD